MIIIGAIAAGLLLHAIFTNDTGLREPATKTVSISGIIDFAGLKPNGGDAGTVKVYQRLHGDSNTEYADTGISVPLEDNAVWSWDSAVEGMTYDIKAILNAGDELITESPVLTVSAPAANQVLVLDVSWDMIPDKVAEDYPVTVGGTVRVNGYIPTGAKIVGYGRRSDVVDSTFVQGPSADAVVLGDWVWDKALNGRKYQFYAELVDSAGVSLGTSDNMTKTAPFTDGHLLINSKATPPPAPVAKTTISGVVRVSGKIQEGSMIDIHVRRADEEAFNTMMSVAASGEVPWSWANADNGVLYEMRAVLDLPSGTDPMGTTVSVTAPASDVVLKIDSGSSLSAPNQKPVLVSCEDLEDGKKKAELEYDGISGATNFWIEIGDEKGKSNKMDQKYTAPKSDSELDVEVKIEEGKDFYTRYAYTTCPNCGEGTYSSFSESLKFRCD